MYVTISKFNPEKDYRYEVPGQMEYIGISCIDSADYAPFTIEDYLEIEHRYWLVIKSVLENLGFRKGILSHVELYDDFISHLKDKKNNWRFLIEESYKYARSAKLEVGQKIELDKIEPLLKGSLREAIYVSIDFADNTYLRIGYDMYTYVGSNRDFSWKDQDGIFVTTDSEISPWMQDDDGNPLSVPDWDFS